MGSARLSWLFAPWHVAALATGAKSFRDNPVIGSPTLNRAGLHVARVRLAHRMAEWRRQRLSSLISEEDRSGFRARRLHPESRTFCPLPIMRRSSSRSCRSADRCGISSRAMR